MWGEGLAVVSDLDGNVYSTGMAYGNPFDVYGAPTFLGPGICNIYISKCDASGNPIWMNAAGGDYYVYGNSLAVDGNKNLFIAGCFKGDSMVMGSLKLYNNSFGSDRKNFFIAKLDSLGNFVWLKGGTCIYDNYVNVVYTDDLDNLYITGSYSFTPMTVDTITLPSCSVEDVFIAKYTNNGDIVWAKSFQGMFYESSLGMAFDGLNNLYVGGMHPGNISMDVDTLFGGGSYISKFDLDGNLIWLKNGNIIMTGMAANSIGDIYLCGNFGGTLILGSDTLVSAGSGDFVLAKHDSSGNLIWGKSVGGFKNDYCTNVTTDPFGNAYIAGHYFSDSISIEGNTYDNQSGASVSSDLLYIKFDSVGQIKWVQETGGLAYDWNGGLSFNEASGSLCAIGSFQSPYIDFGSASFTNSGISLSGTRADIFLCSMSPSSVSVEELSSKSKLIVYPNPFSDELFFSIEMLPQGKKLEIQLIDILGKVVYQLPIVTSEGIIKTNADVKAGVYFLSIVSDERVYNCKKIIKIN